MVWKRCLLELKLNMQTLKTLRYLEELEIILDFIAEDSLNKALEFADEINKQVLKLDMMPFRCRQSLKSDDNNVRDLIFYGYVIPYRVNIEKGRIEILGIFSENEWEL